MVNRDKTAVNILNQLINLSHKVYHRRSDVTLIWFYWRLPFCFNLGKEHRPAPSSGNKDLKHGKNGFDLLPGPDFGPGLNLYWVVYRAKFTDFCSAIFSNDEKRKFWSKFRWFCDSLSVLEREVILQKAFESRQSPFGKKILFEKSVFILQDWLWSRDLLMLTG